MTHEEFLSTLANLGIVIKVEHSSGETDFYLTLNKIRVSTKNYAPFGYYCGGQYAMCNRTQQQEFTQEDINEAIKTAINIQRETIIMLDNEINYHDIKDYLRNYAVTKVDKNAVERVGKILKDNYQELHFKRERVKNPRY